MNIFIPIFIAGIILLLHFVWPLTFYYRAITLIATLGIYFLLMSLFVKGDKWPPEEKKIYKEFVSENLNANWVNPPGGYEPGKRRSGEYFYNIEIYDWADREGYWLTPEGYNSPDFRPYKNSGKYSGIIYKEMIFGDKWHDAKYFGVWNLKSNSTINVEWIAVNGSHSVGWFYSVYGKKSGWVNVSESSIFTPIALEDEKKGYLDNKNMKYYIKEPIKIDFSPFKWGFFALIMGLIMHIVIYFRKVREITP